MESPSETLEFVRQLCNQFREQVGKALQFSLEIESSGLALVDHYLSLARSETRVPVLSLLAAGAGAYFGELVRKEVGGFWIGDAKDPRRLRLLLDVQPIFFSPFDIAYESILSESIPKDDPRHPEGLTLDTEFHVGSLSTTQDDQGIDSGANTLSIIAPDRGDASSDSIREQEWVRQRLDEIAPVDSNVFHSLTGRYETLSLIINLLATKHLAQGKQPRKYSLQDYISLLTATKPD